MAGCPPIRMLILPSRRAMKWIASSRKKCDGATVIIAAGATAALGAGAATVIGAGAVVIGVGAAGIGAGALPPPLVPPLLLASPLLVGRRDGLIPQALSTQVLQYLNKKKAPHEVGLLSDPPGYHVQMDAAASVAPNRAVRADAGAGPYHERPVRAAQKRRGAAIGLASAIGAAMKAGAASARGIRCAEACE